MMSNGTEGATAQDAKRSYTAPQLVVFGGVVALTANGSGPNSESAWDWDAGTCRSYYQPGEDGWYSNNCHLWQTRG